MCGIWGFSGPRAVDETKLRLLAIENLSRGRDSTGVYGNHMYKDNVDSKLFIQQSGFKAAIKGAKTVGGHTRAATVGSTSKENAHPFFYGANTEWATVGAHNGFIVPSMLPIHTKDFGFENDFAVDSMLIFASLAKFKDVNIISKIEGGMAIWFILPNKDKDKIYLYKRGQTRDLHIGQASDGLYFSSEAAPLRYIGCNAADVYNLAPDVLYTLSKGEIIDRYPMTLPVLKSLSAGVSRTDWRKGVPLVELDALPSGARGVTHRGANGNTHNRGGALDTIDTWNGSRNKTAVVGKQVTMFSKVNEDEKSVAMRSNILDKYNAKNNKTLHEAVNLNSTNIDDFHLFIGSLKAELSHLEVEPMPYLSTRSMTYQDYQGCVLMFKLLNKDKDEPLECWSLINDDDPDLCGLTTPNGCSIIKVPPKYVATAQPLEFKVYDPVDELGPYHIKLTPERGRVMEVTLSIPFRKEDKEQGSDNTDNIIGSSPVHKAGGEGNTVHIPGLPGRVPNDTSKGSNSAVLCEQAGSIHSRLEDWETHGQIQNEENTSDLVPQTDTVPVKLRPDLCVINQRPTAKRSMIRYVLKLDKDGYYANWRNQIESIKTFMFTNPDVYVYKGLYEEQMLEDQNYVVNVKQLIMDANRLRGWEKFTYRTYYKLVVYIDMLLKEFPEWYLKEGAFLLHEDREKGGPNIVSEQYSPFYLRKQQTEDKQYTRNISFRGFVAWLMWMKKPKIMEKMSKQELINFRQDVASLSSVLETLIGATNEGLRNDENGGSKLSTVKLRLAATKSRAFLQSELDDITDFGQQLDSRLAAIKSMESDDLNQQLESRNESSCSCEE